MTDTIKTWEELKTLSNNQWSDEDCMKEEIEQLRAALAEALASKLVQPAWRCTGLGLKKYLTQTQYDAQTDGIKSWYEPCSPADADQSPILTIGQYKEKAQPPGCQLHNLQCGYPACDRKSASPTVNA